MPPEPAPEAEDEQQSGNDLPAEAGATRQLAVPLAGVTAGQLKIRAGARLTLRVDPASRHLIVAHFEDPAPQIQIRGGTVTIQHRQLWQLANEIIRERGQLPAGEIMLNGAIPWEIQIRGGLRQLTGDLSQLRLTSLDIGGGASNIDLILPAPRGTVPIRLRGGATGVDLHRPPDVAARFTVSGIVRNLTLDEQRVETIGFGRTRLETPGYPAAADRYDISATGGVNDVTVDAVES